MAKSKLFNIEYKDGMIVRSYSYEYTEEEKKEMRKPIPRVASLTATDLVIIGAENRGEPLTKEDYANSDILFDLQREQSLTPSEAEIAQYAGCFRNCESLGIKCECRERVKT